MRFELFVATRYLRAKRRQAVVGLVTIISIIGVAAGVASLIIALAINNGFRQDLQDRLLGSTSHVNLLRVESDGIRGWKSVLQRLDAELRLHGNRYAPRQHATAEPIEHDRQIRGLAPFSLLSPAVGN